MYLKVFKTEENIKMVFENLNKSAETVGIKFSAEGLTGNTL